MMETKICRYCDEPLFDSHGNLRYCPDKGCAYEAKKQRTINQYAIKSTQADSIWANEKILREYYYKYGLSTEIDPYELETAGFDFDLNSEEKKVDDLVIYCMRKFGYSFLKNKKLIIWKLS